MKILMVTDSFYPDNIGGSENVIYHLSRYLIAKGHEVYVLVRRGELGDKYSDEIDGIKIIRYDDKIRSFGLLYVPSVVGLKRAFYEITQKIKFDIFHFHHSLTAHALISKKMNSVYTFYGPSAQEFEAEVYDRRHKYSFLKRITMPLWVKAKSIVLKKMERKSLDKASRIIVNSDYMKKMINEIHGNKYDNIIEKVPAGADIYRFKPAENKDEDRSKINLPKDKFIILTVRRLVARMGVENLVQAIPGVIKLYPDIHLVIAGKGYMREKLEKTVSDLNLSGNVAFAGFVNDDLLPVYYRSADLFVLPTKELEGFGIVTIEALASGIPVLGTKIASTEEVLGNFDKTLLIPDTNPKSIEKKIIEYLKRQDKDEIKKRAREYAKQFGWDNVNSKILRQYENIIDLSRVRSK